MAKSQKCKKVYIDKDGNEHNHAASATHNAVDIVALEFRFSDGEVRRVEAAHYDAETNAAFAWFGRSEKLGNSYADSEKKGKEPIELFDTLNENLRGGMWVNRGESGGETAPGILVDAVLSALEKAGTPGDRAKVEARLSPRNDDGSLDKAAAKTARQGALANAAIKAEYEAVKAARAAERAKKAKADAKGADTDLSAFV